MQDISFLKKLTNLTYIEMKNLQLSSLEDLSECKELERIELTGEILSLDGLQNHPNLGHTIIVPTNEITLDFNVLKDVRDAKDVKAEDYYVMIEGAGVGGTVGAENYNIPTNLIVSFNNVNGLRGLRNLKEDVIPRMTLNMRYIDKEEEEEFIEIVNNLKIDEIYFAVAYPKINLGTLTLNETYSFEIKKLSKIAEYLSSENCKLRIRELNQSEETYIWAPSAECSYDEEKEIITITPKSLISRSSYLGDEFQIKASLIGYKSNGFTFYFDYDVEAKDEEVVDFTDENLANLIRSELGLVSDAKITAGMMKELTSLDIGPSVKYLNGLEFAVNLENLSVWTFDKNSSEIRTFEDISPLSNLKKLKYLSLGIVGKDTDLSPLKNLKNLEDIYIRYKNELDIDFSPVGSLSKLKKLQMENASHEIYGTNRYGINDLSFLQNLSNLENISLDYVYGYEYSYEDFKNLINLKEIEINHTRYIYDLSFLKDCTNLEKINLGSAIRVNNLDCFKNMKNLKVISLETECEVRDISGLRGLTKLEEVSINNTNDLELDLSIFADNSAEILYLTLGNVTKITNASSLKNKLNLSLKIKDRSCLNELKNIKEGILSVRNQWMESSSLHLKFVDDARIINNKEEADELINILENIKSDNIEVKNLKERIYLGELELNSSTTYKVRELSNLYSKIVTGSGWSHDGRNYSWNCEDETITISPKDMVSKDDNAGSENSEYPVIVEFEPNTMNSQLILELTYDTIEPVSPEVEIKDENLRKYLLDNYDKSQNGKLTESEMLEIERLAIPDTYSVKDLSGMEYSKNLKNLTINNSNELTNIEPLKDLNKLEEMAIYGISKNVDVSILGNLTNLNILSLGFNHKYKDVNNEKIREKTMVDFSFLKKLSNLTSLNLGGIEGNNDLSAIANLTKLRELYIGLGYDETDKDIIYLTDISFMRNLNDLRRLDLYDVKLDNLDDIKNCKNMDWIYIERGEVKDISTIKNLTELTFIYMILSNDLTLDMDIFSNFNKHLQAIIRENIVNIINADKLDNENLDLSLNITVKNRKALKGLCDLNKKGYISLGISFEDTTFNGIEDEQEFVDIITNLGEKNIHVSIPQCTSKVFLGSLKQGIPYTYKLEELSPLYKLYRSDNNNTSFGSGLWGMYPKLEETNNKYDEVSVDIENEKVTIIPKKLRKIKDGEDEYPTVVYGTWDYDNYRDKHSIYITYNVVDEEIVRGDLDGDGEISLYDAFTILRNAILDNPDMSLDEIEIMDYDGDGKVTLYDAFMILRAAILAG